MILQNHSNDIPLLKKNIYILWANDTVESFKLTFGLFYY